MYKLGIDLGGTNIVAGVVDENYKIVGIGKRKTNVAGGAEAIADDMAAAAFDAIKDANLTIDDIEDMGIGAPGTVDSETGDIPFSNNLYFYDVPLGKMMEERVGKKFYLENDANAAAYGEYIAGAGKGSNHFVAITLGTGVGSGIIIDGKILSGSNHAGGEMGHSVIVMNGEKCTCGRHGCWEAYASATALINQTKQAMIRYPESIMWDICNRDLDTVDGKTAFDAAEKGDIAAKYVVDRYIEYIAVGIANVVNAFQPDMVCIGGGVSKQGDVLIKPIKQFVNGENFARNITKDVVIKTATLGNDAGIIGAAYLCNLHK
ncbi:MAG: ROK family protein [Clostridia bacterium]|nr:ROK family protein [Clostridia bacterium]